MFGERRGGRAAVVRGAAAARGERAAGGSAERSGGLPPITGSGECAGRSSRGMASKRASVYGIRTRVNSCGVDACSTIWPAYITMTSSAQERARPRSWLISISVMPSSARNSSSSSMICAWVVTSSAVVASSAMSSFGRQASAMAIMMRCRMPPESWCGYS